MIVKLRSQVTGNRIRETVFVGTSEADMAMAGALVLTLSEWQLLGAALLLGADHLAPHIRVITEGDAEVVAAHTDPPFRTRRCTLQGQLRGTPRS